MITSERAGDMIFTFVHNLTVMFQVKGIDELVERLLKQGAELVGEVMQYENTYRLCYIRGVEGILVGLAEQLGQES